MVLDGAGDATVPLLSLGGVCGSPWHSRALNPSGVRVVTRQYKHGGTAVMGCDGEGMQYHPSTACMRVCVCMWI